MITEIRIERNYYKKYLIHYLYFLVMTKWIYEEGQHLPYDWKNK